MDPVPGGINDPEAPPAPGNEETWTHEGCGIGHLSRTSVRVCARLKGLPAPGEWRKAVAGPVANFQNAGD